MHDIQIVHGLEALDHLDEDAPDELFFEALVLLVGLGNRRALPLEALHDLAVEVAHVHELHDDAEGLRLLINESFFVTNNIIVIY